MGLNALLRHNRLRQLWRAMHVWQGVDVTAPASLLPTPLKPYQAWLYWNRPSAAQRRFLQQELAALTPRLRFSLLLPMVDENANGLAATCASLLQQIYPDWELVIVAGGSGAAGQAGTWVDRDPRIRLLHQPGTDSIVQATNDAAAGARGDYVVLLAPGDQLTAAALTQVALYLAAHPECEWLYSDEDSLSAEGVGYAPRFKPDWSPEYLLAYAYVGNLAVIHIDLWRAVGGMRLDFAGAHQHDLFLRAGERAAHVGHLPQILYRQQTMGDTVATTAVEAGRRAVADAFARRGLPCVVVQPEWARVKQIAAYAPICPDDGPSVAILIPTRNQRPLLQACIESLRQTTYTNYCVYVIDNQSDDADTQRYLVSLQAGEPINRCAVVVWCIPNIGKQFNFAHVNNVAAARVTADYLLFLNNDVVVSDPRWLSQMVGYARLAGVGAVGARLLFADGRVQHAGVLHGLHDGMVGHAFKFKARHDLGYLLQAQVSRNCSAVTAACLLTPRPLFLGCGGFDVTSFGLSYNDVDYCARVREQGLRVVYVPVELYHHESVSRSRSRAPADQVAMRKRYGSVRDPYYNPHLRLDETAGTFALRPGIVDWTVMAKSRSPIRTLFVTPHLNCGGDALSHFELIRGLKRAGVVDPLLFSFHDGCLRTDYEAAEIPIVVGEPIEPAARVTHIVQVIRQSGAEVLHASTVDLAWAVLAAAQAAIPSLWHIAEGVGWYDYFRRSPVADAVAALQALALPYRVILGSMAAHTRWLPLERTGNFCVIHRGFDAEHFRVRHQSHGGSRADARHQLGIPENQLLLLTLGAVCSSKRLQDLVQAISALDDVAPQVRLMMVGERPSPDRAYLHALVDRLPSARRPHVTIVPETVDVAPFWRAADIFYCADTSASFPRVLQEAMACGLPIIAPSIYGIPKMVQPGYNAECYPAGDVKALTTAIKRLATDAELRQSYAANAPIQLASSFSFAEMISTFDRLLGEARLTATTPVAPLAATDRFTLGSVAGKADLLRVAVAAALHQNRYLNQGGNGLR